MDDDDDDDGNILKLLRLSHRVRVDSSIGVVVDGIRYRIRLSQWPYTKHNKTILPLIDCAAQAEFSNRAPGE